MGKHRLKAGYTHIVDRKELPAGSEVELTDEQALAFADRFEPVDAKPADDEQGKGFAATPNWETVLEGTIDSIGAFINSDNIQTAAQLHELIATEEAHRNRKGVLAFASKRLEELS